MWVSHKLSGFVADGSKNVPESSPELLAESVMGPGETLGKHAVQGVGGQEFGIYEIEGAGTPESITVASPLGMVVAQRTIGDIDAGKRRIAGALSFSRLAEALPSLAGKGLTNLGLIVLFIGLLVQRRIAFGNAVLVALVALACAIPSWLAFSDSGYYQIVQSLLVLGGAIWIFVVWSSSESWLRSYDPALVRGIDSLRWAMIGPRVGSALIGAWSVGAALAGITLAATAISATLPGLRPTTTSLPLPIFGSSSPLHEAVGMTGAIVLLFLASTWLEGRWATAVAVGGGAFAIAPRLHLAPYPYRFVVALAIAAILVVALKRIGLTGVFVATLAMSALPALVFASRHASWMPWSVTGAALLGLGPLALGVVAVSRSSDAESVRLAAPGFVRRLEQERRIRHEMDLLATMQLRLLPQTPPMQDGWDVAARSILATEVGGDLYDFLDDDEGGLWIAVGDVSGHGYSCAIAQAMTKAGLTSIVNARETPASVLHQLDRVLRRSGSQRTFTSLAIARLDPATGEGIWANAGNPYPILVSPQGKGREVISSALPLGMGPPRRYVDRPISIERGGALVFYSDGLYEARNERDREFGFERPLEIIERTWRRPAAAILDALVSAWRQHVGMADVTDDTTIVVIRRSL